MLMILRCGADHGRSANVNILVYSRVQRLHAPIQHLREASVIGYFRDWNAVVGKYLGRAASGQEGNA